MNLSKIDIVVITILCNLVVVGVIISSAHILDKESKTSPSATFKKIQPSPANISEQRSSDTVAHVSFDEIDRLLEDYIPTAEEKPPQRTEKKKTTKGRFYIIQEGDNPWKIAKKFHLSYEKLLVLNGLDEKSAKNLKIGQKILIQEGA